MKDSKRKFNLILYSVLAIVLTCAIIIGGILFVNGSVAWFAKNNNVNANGMTVNLKDLGITDLYYIRYDMREKAANSDEEGFVTVANGWFQFENLTPGETVTIKAVYKSDQPEERPLSVYFKDLGGGEVPIEKQDTEGEKYYYFGTQLRVTKINEVAIDVSEFKETLNNTSEYLVTPPQNKIFYESKLEPAANDLHLADLKVSSTKDCSIIFTVEFVNHLTENQDDYKNFGKPNGTCKRQLVAYVG